MPLLRLFPAACGAVLFSGFLLVARAADMPPPEVVVESVQAAPLPLVFEYSARTAGFREVQVRAQVSGILQERTYLEGSQVKQGQVMFRIDPRTYQAALARAKGALAQEQARYRQTERDLKRIRELQKKGFASESELDNAISNFEQSKANIQAAEAEVQSKQIDLDYCTVKAPISGITSRETVSEGSLMVAGDPNASLLSNITQLHPLYVNFAAPDSDVESVRAGLQSGDLVLPDDGKMHIAIQFGDVGFQFVTNRHHYRFFFGSDLAHQVQVRVVFKPVFRHVGDVHGGFQGEQVDFFQQRQFFFVQVKRAQRLGFVEVRLDFLQHSFHSHGVLVLAFGGFGVAVKGFVHRFQVGQGQFGVDHLDIRRRIHAVGDVDNIVIVKATHDVGDSVSFADVGEKFIAQSFTFGGARHQTGDIHELHGGGHDPLRIDDLGQFVLARVGHCYHASVGFNGAEREVFGADTGVGQRIKQGGFADVG